MLKEIFKEENNKLTELLTYGPDGSLSYKDFRKNRIVVFEYIENLLAKEFYRSVIYNPLLNVYDVEFSGFTSGIETKAVKISDMITVFNKGDVSELVYNVVNAFSKKIVGDSKYFSPEEYKPVLMNEFIIDEDLSTFPRQINHSIFHKCGFVKK
jgi:hypothetical protein